MAVRGLGEALEVLLVFLLMAGDEDASGVEGAAAQRGEGSLAFNDF